MVRYRKTRPTDYYMRPGFITDTGATQWAHLQLWNPVNSGYIAEEIELQILNCRGGFRIGMHGTGVGMLDGATFPESRGLASSSNPIRPYSVCHTRMTKTEQTPDGNGYILIGQQINYPKNHNDIIHWPGLMHPGHGLLIIGNSLGAKPYINFRWQERAI